MPSTFCPVKDALRPLSGSVKLLETACNKLSMQWKARDSAHSVYPQAARDSEKEVRELLAAREREERSISLVTPYYDVVREKHGESDEEPEEAVNTQANYLTPFMPPLVGARQLTRAEALEVREKCLKVC